MKILIIPIVLACVLLQSCNGSKNKPSLTTPVTDSLALKDSAAKQRFFPLTDYIKGQIFEIRQKGINPIKYHTVNDRTDSVWLKTEEFAQAFSEFLDPVIDTTNMTGLFTEKKFMDRSIDAFTFTYDPTGSLPDSETLVHWDVYIDPETEKVRRIYMVKNIGPAKTIQLTWQSDKWCKTTYILNKPDGSSVVEKEEKINWDF